MPEPSPNILNPAPSLVFLMCLCACAGNVYARQCVATPVEHIKATRVLVCVCVCVCVRVCVCVFCF